MEHKRGGVPNQGDGMLCEWNVFKREKKKRTTRMNAVHMLLLHVSFSGSLFRPPPPSSPRTPAIAYVHPRLFSLSCSLALSFSLFVPSAQLYASPSLALSAQSYASPSLALSSRS